MKQNSRHQCLIYEGAPSQQLPALAAITKQKLNENYRCLYLNSPPMVAGMRSYLSALGIDIANESAKSRLVLSSEPVVSPFGKFDSDIMIRQLDDAVVQAMNDGHTGLFATGDMTWELGPRQSFSSLVRYEWGLEKLFRKWPSLCGICQYHVDTLPREAVRKGLLSHQTLFINETLSCLNEYYAPTEEHAEQASQNTDLDTAITKVCQPKGVN
jgi:hypothetical protein